jgi:hypothetical protein
LAAEAERLGTQLYFPFEEEEKDVEALVSFLFSRS